jgi:hypothetical protein
MSIFDAQMFERTTIRHVKSKNYNAIRNLCSHDHITQLMYIHDTTSHKFNTLVPAKLTIAIANGANPSSVPTLFHTRIAYSLARFGLRHQFVAQITDYLLAQMHAQTRHVPPFSVKNQIPVIPILLDFPLYHVHSDCCLELSVILTGCRWQSRAEIFLLQRAQPTVYLLDTRGKVAGT